ncbi:MAG: hypothetical protein AAGC88_13750, partial [Bacteroidota bacterium]
YHILIRKILISSLLLLMLISVRGYSQNRDFDQWSHGFQISRHQDEFDLGLHFITPTLDRWRFTIKSNIH